MCSYVLVSSEENSTALVPSATWRNKFSGIACAEEGRALRFQPLGSCESFGVHSNRNMVTMCSPQTVAEKNPDV